jgi:hypothetical protein
MLPALVDIEDPQRLNLSGDDVIEKLQEAESFWAAMAIPFAVAVLNEYLVEVLSMFQAVGVAEAAGAPDELMLGAVREALESSKKGCGLEPDTKAAKTLDFVQRLRNDIIHSGGYISEKQVERWNDMDAVHHEAWEKAAGRAPKLVVGHRADLGAGEVRACLSATHGYAKSINGQAGKKLPKSVWGEIAAKDWQASYPHLWADVANRPRRAVRYATARYADIGLTEVDLAPALVGLASL